LERFERPSERECFEKWKVYQGEVRKTGEGCREGIKRKIKRGPKKTRQFKLLDEKSVVLKVSRLPLLEQFHQSSPRCETFC